MVSKNLYGIQVFIFTGGISVGGASLFLSLVLYIFGKPTFSRSSTRSLRLCTSSVTFSARLRPPPAGGGWKQRLALDRGRFDQKTRCKRGEADQSRGGRAPPVQVPLGLISQSRTPSDSDARPSSIPRPGKIHGRGRVPKVQTGESSERLRAHEEEWEWWGGGEGGETQKDL